MANLSGRYGRLTDGKQRFQSFFRDRKRLLLIAGAAIALIAAAGGVMHLFGRQNMIALLTPTPEALAAPTPAPTDTPTPTDTPEPTPTNTPLPTDTPAPTLPLYGEVRMYPDESSLWARARQGVSAPRESMNIRSGPDGSYPPIDTFGIGRRVTVFGQQGEWYYIWYAGKFGWAHQELIRLGGEEPASTAVVYQKTEGGQSRLIALPEETAPHRLLFQKDSIRLDGGTYRAVIGIEQCVTFPAKEIAALAIGSKLRILDATVEVESLMWERDEAGEPVGLLINDAYRIADDPDIGGFCLVSIEDGARKPQWVPFPAGDVEIVFAANAVVVTPDTILWDAGIPAPTAGTDGVLPTQSIPLEAFCSRIADCPAESFPPQSVSLTIEDGVATRMDWSFLD